MRKAFLNWLMSNRWSITVFLISGLLGVALFFYEFSSLVINPANDQWLRAGGDAGQHYLGWLFYRDSEWHWILGFISGLAYPHGLALTYMDSIPLLAIPLKLLSAFLPSTFQYFGLWGVICYSLQGALAGIILKRLTKNVPVSIVGSFILSLSPLVMQRMFEHTALAGHWILLFGIYALIRFKTASKTSSFALCWIIIMSLAVTIHPYFIPMTAALLLMSVVRSFTNIFDFLVRLFLPVLSGLFLFFLIGGFIVKDVSASGIGVYGLNLNGLVNSLGWSGILNQFSAPDGAYEALAYIGFGILTLLGFTLVLLLMNRKKFLTNASLQQKIKQYTTARWIGIYGISLLIFIAAIGPTISFGKHDIVLVLPHKIEEWWSTFRATGRLFWPLYYLVVIGIIASTFKVLYKMKVHSLIILTIFIGAISLQTVDTLTSQKAQSKRLIFAQLDDPALYPSQIEKWKEYAKGKRHIVFILENGIKQELYNPIAFFAADHGLTLSDGYFARSPIESIQKATSAAQAEIEFGRPNPDTIYVTDKSELVKKIYENSKLKVFEENKQYIVTTR